MKKRSPKVEVPYQVFEIGPQDLKIKKVLYEYVFLFLCIINGVSNRNWRLKLDTTPKSMSYFYFKMTVNSMDFCKDRINGLIIFPNKKFLACQTAHYF